MIFDLYIGRKATGVSVQPDATWPNMWRVHQGANVSDMVNILRAIISAGRYIPTQTLQGHS